MNNRALITALVEWWHSEMCLFHLPTSEASITLEDVWWILHIWIHGEQVVYDHRVGITGLCQLFECEEQHIPLSSQYEIEWGHLEDTYCDLIVVLCIIIRGLLIPNKRCHGFLVGWGRVIYGMIIKRWVYACGPCLLTILYYQMHGIVYLTYRSIIWGIIILKAWGLEHIVIFRPVVHVQLQDKEHYAYRYTPGIRHRGSRNIMY